MPAYLYTYYSIILSCGLFKNGTRVRNCILHVNLKKKNNNTYYYDVRVQNHEPFQIADTRLPL